MRGQILAEFDKKDTPIKTLQEIIVEIYFQKTWLMGSEVKFKVKSTNFQIKTLLKIVL